MGEIADMMIDGTMCGRCGEFLDDPMGFPTLCGGCAMDDKRMDPNDPTPVNKPKDPRTLLCREHPHCERRFRTKGAERQHWIDKHDTAGDRQT